MIDPSSILARVANAVRLAGEGAWLLGYDINGIQELVTASNRPITMRGASQTIKDFDAATGKDVALSIFAGGGRGVELACSEADARARIEHLKETFRIETHGGVLAAAAVPYRRDLPQASLAWLRLKLGVAKDAAVRPGGKLPPNKDGQCMDCCALHADHTIRGKDDEERLVCTRCFRLIAKARGTGEASKSLLDFASNRRIAAISADGNSLGTFFASLTSLEEMAVASQAVADIFREAHEEASRRVAPMKVLAPVTGGDDIRVFLPPNGVLLYVEALVCGVEHRAAAAGSLGGVLAPARALMFSRIGVGVGAVVAGDHYPASRLMDYAHKLELSAKAICHTVHRTSDTAGGPGARSAFDFAVLTAGEAQVGREARSPLSMEETAWTKALRSARALRKVPTTQRAILAKRSGMPSEEEFENLLRYQVARSSKWQEWFNACEIDWTDRAALREHVGRLRLDLLDLMPAEDGGV